MGWWVRCARGKGVREVRGNRSDSGIGVGWWPHSSRNGEEGRGSIVQRIDGRSRGERYGGLEVEIDGGRMHHIRATPQQLQRTMKKKMVLRPRAESRSTSNRVEKIAKGPFEFLSRRMIYIGGRAGQFLRKRGGTGDMYASSTSARSSLTQRKSSCKPL